MFLLEIAARPELDGHVAERLRKIKAAPWNCVAVWCEPFFIDFVVDVASAEGAIIVSIENMVDAREQLDQIAKNQEAVEQTSPQRNSHQTLYYGCVENVPSYEGSDWYGDH